MQAGDALRADRSGGLSCFDGVGSQGWGEDWRGLFRRSFLFTFARCLGQVGSAEELSVEQLGNGGVIQVGSPNLIGWLEGFEGVITLSVRTPMFDLWSDLFN